MRRMDRYNTEDVVKESSRSNKNQDLYQNLDNNIRYANLSDVTNANAFDITKAKENYRTREGYHQLKEYQPDFKTPKEKKELDEINYLYQDHENRIYDINSVLEEARKNRIEKDKLEEKRKLKNTNYNILANLNPEELEQYRKEKKERIIKPDEQELRSLIDTITSKTLAGEIDKATSVNLLSDLMATNIMDKVKPQEEKEDEKDEKDEELSLSKEILDAKQLKQIQNVKEAPKEEPTKKGALQNADSDFYTRSMDLSEHDLSFKDEFSDKKLPIIVKLILFIVILFIIAVAAYFIKKNM